MNVKKSVLISRLKARLCAIARAERYEKSGKILRFYRDPVRRERDRKKWSKELQDLLNQPWEPGQGKIGKVGRKKGGKNTFECSNGERVTQAQIDARRSAAYREKYQGGLGTRCTETGETAQGSSHIVAQKRCKNLHKTELIWALDNFFPATNAVNKRWEDGDETLPHYWEYMEIVKKYDPEGYRARLFLKKQLCR